MAQERADPPPAPDCPLRETPFGIKIIAQVHAEVDAARAAHGLPSLDWEALLARSAARKFQNQSAASTARARLVKRRVMGEPPLRGPHFVELALRVWRTRTRLGLSQAASARKIGISQTILSRLETGTYQVRRPGRALAAVECWLQRHTKGGGTAGTPIAPSLVAAAGPHAKRGGFAGNKAAQPPVAQRARAK